MFYGEDKDCIMLKGMKSDVEGGIELVRTVSPFFKVGYHF